METGVKLDSYINVLLDSVWKQCNSFFSQIHQKDQNQFYFGITNVAVIDDLPPSDIFSLYIK